MTRSLCLLLLAAAGFAWPLGAQNTAADTADHRCVVKNTDTLETANGGGRRRNLANRVRECANRWLARDSVATPPHPANTAPVAAFVVSDASGKCYVNRICTFDAAPSKDDKGITGYQWDCAVTPNCTSTGRTASAIYPDTLTQRTVRLTVRDAEGLTGQMARTIQVVDTTTKPPPVTNTAPVASFPTPTCVSFTRNCAANGSSSTDDKAVTSYTWTWGDNTPPVTSSAATSTHTYAAAGTYTVTLVVRDAEGLTSSPLTRSVTLIAPPDTSNPLPPGGDTTNVALAAVLPRTVPSFTIPTPTRSYTVAGNLQQALDTAKANDEIRLTNTTFTGNFVLKTRPCDGTWITIRSVAAPPDSGRRPTATTAASFAKIVSPNTAPAIKTANPTCGWRILGVSISGTLARTSIQYGLLWLGDGGWTGGGETQTDSTKVPKNILVDRVYFYGPELNSMRCIALNSGATIIRDSWIGDCHASGFDSQAIVGWNGPGPYLIDNNYLEGAGENVMFGGADPGIAGMVPRDITITRNHFYKPLVWKDIWTIKNSIEFKTAQYVLIEGNVFENNWPAAQEGVGIVFKANANGCECTYLGTRDVTFRYNIGKNMPVAWGLHAADDSYGWTGFVHFQRASFTHNLFTNIGAEGSRQSLLLATQDLQDIEIAHNTIVHAPTAAGIVMPMAYSFGAAHRLEIRDNVFTSMAGYAFHNSDNGTVHSPALNAFASDRTWVFLRNVVGGMLPDYVSQNPAGSFYPATVAGIGLNADYALSASSPYKGKGENGTDPGANIDEVNRRTAGVAAAASALAARRSGAPARPVRPRALTPREWEYIRRQPVSRDIKLP